MSQNNSIVRQQGFTVIELILSLAFLSVMLLFVVTTTVQVMRSYNKGLTIKQMNQTGRSVTEDMARTARLAWAESVYDMADQGRLCVGGVSYVWNEPEVDGDSPITSNRFTDGSQLDIVRIDDQTQQYCKNPGLNIPLPAADERVSVISNGAVRILGMEAAQSDDKRLLSLAFSVSSVGVDKPKKVGSSYQCPTDSAALFGSFCALADFDTTVYLRNKNGD
jgi:hypothetical protein